MNVILSLYDTYLFEDLAAMKTQVHWRPDAPHRHVQRRDDSFPENSRMHAGQDITECNSHTDLLFDLERHSVSFRGNVQTIRPGSRPTPAGHTIPRPAPSASYTIYGMHPDPDMPDLPLCHVEGYCASFQKRSRVLRRQVAMLTGPRFTVKDSGYIVSDRDQAGA